MDDTTRPLTKHQVRVRSDVRARSIYARRRDIDRYHERKRLERELKELA